MSTEQRLPRYVSEPYTDEDLIKLEKAFLRSSSYARNTAAEFHRYRDIMILKMACVLGLRPSEALTLQWERIDWATDRIHPHPYSNKMRETEPIILSAPGKNLLLQWRSIFEKYISTCPWVFPSLQTFEPLSLSAYNKRLRQISAEAGIYKVLWFTQAGQPIGNRRFYSARKHFGTKFYENTKDVYSTMVALRQTKLSSPQPYIRAASKDSIKDIMDRIF